jgi:hypothetical protein
MNWLVDCYVETFVRTMLYWYYLPAYITDMQINGFSFQPLVSNPRS